MCITKGFRPASEGRSRYIISLLAILVPLLMALPAVAADSVVVNIDRTACPYADSHLDDKMAFYLSSMNCVGTVHLTKDRLVSDDFASLLRRGQEQGGRFLVDIAITKMDIIQKKQTIFPQIAFRHRTYAVLHGTIRVVDISWKRLLKLEHIDYEIKASDQWQFVDDDSNDPALLVPADKKIVLFDELEDEAARALAADIMTLVKEHRLAK